MRAAAVVLALGGCLSVPSLGQPKCSSNDDCNRGAGEVCEDGLCWGNPPPGPYAAALAPPIDRTDLVTTELSLLAIPDHGWMGDLVVDASVTISGRIEAYCAQPAMCDSGAIGAQIIVSRPPAFPGGPGFHASVQSQAGVARGADSFSITVPRTRDGEPPYVMSIVPDGRTEPPMSGGVSDAELAPPAQLTVVATDNVSLPVTLGSPDSQVLSGLVADSSGHPLHDYRVVALGRFDASGQPTEVSTVAFSADGTYSITLADGLVGPVELVARPIDPTVVAPSLHIGGVAAVSGSRTIGQPAYLGQAATFQLTVEGLSTSGPVVPVVGARVSIIGSYAPALAASVYTDFEYDATTDDHGTAHLWLLDGSALLPSYVLRVIPPSGSNPNLGVAYDVPLAQTTSEVGSPTLRLPQRIALSGKLVDSQGNPIGKVSVTAAPSLRFQWSLDGSPLSFLDAIPAATTASTDDGNFSVYVDPVLADTWGHYDLTFEPPATSGAPHWTLTDVEIPRVMAETTLPLGKVTIPDAAYIHGRITDAGGTPVASGTLSIFQLGTNPSLCSQVAHAPAGCAIPAQLVGHGVSDAAGTVELTLPR